MVSHSCVSCTLYLLRTLWEALCLQRGCLLWECLSSKIPFLSTSRCNREIQLTLCLETASSWRRLFVSLGGRVCCWRVESLECGSDTYSLFTCQCYCMEFVCMSALGAVCEWFLLLHCNRKTNYLTICLETASSAVNVSISFGGCIMW